MEYTSCYVSPLGKILLAADGIGLTGLWFEGQKYFARCLGQENEEVEIPLFYDVKKWLDLYFSGKEPKEQIPLHMKGTDFQKEVWKILCAIPYGQTMTYGEIAGRMEAERGGKRVAFQAVGNAVGHNPVSVIIPCHRVIGADGKLTGYAGGIERKAALLNIEHGRTLGKDFLR